MHQLVQYLEEFFDRRTDLNHTLNVLFVTHPHIDHSRSLKGIFSNFTVERYIDNGSVSSSGRHAAKWIRREIAKGKYTTSLHEITDDLVVNLEHYNGYSDENVDPLNCMANGDPQIRILAGRLFDDPGWPNVKFGNQNNHSIVIRVDFGESSFLFTGDLEEHAIGTRVDWYDGTSTLDVDVYQVGH